MYAQTALFLGLYTTNQANLLGQILQLKMISCENKPNHEVKGNGFNFTNVVETAQFEIVSFALICYLILFM